MIETPPVPQPPKKRTWLIVLLAVIGGMCIVLPFFAAIAIYGVRKYLVEAKQSEAKNGLDVFARGIAKCAMESKSEGPAGLPPTSRPVPRDMESIRGAKYMSAPSDWQDEAYKCARFSFSTPQLAQYQWVRTSATRGVVRAIGDLDGDSSPDFSFEQEVSCEPPAPCAVRPLKQK
jgi:hypothetical protein